MLRDYVVTVYNDYAKYRHEEGGYFVEGTEIFQQHKNLTLHEARQKFKEYLEQDEYDYITSDYASYHSKYIGEGYAVAIERNNSRTFKPVGFYEVIVLDHYE